MPVVQKIAKVSQGRKFSLVEEAKHGRPFTMITHVLSPDTSLRELDTLRANLANDLTRVVEAGGSVCSPNGGPEILFRKKAWLPAAVDDLRYDEDGTPFLRWSLVTPRDLLEALKGRTPEEVEAVFRDIMERDAATLRELGYDVSIVD